MEHGEKGDLSDLPLLPSPCSTLAGGHGLSVGTPLVPTPSGRHGAQRRARAAPFGAGTRPARSHAQPPFGGEHGEHGEDPPLARSEHRGLCCAGRVIPVIHVPRDQLSEELTDKLSGCAPKCPCQAPQSARAKRPKVPVDKSLIHRLFLQSGRVRQGTCTTMPVRPFTGGGLRRRTIPRPSRLMSAARYWLCTRRTAWVNTSRNFRSRS